MRVLKNKFLVFILVMVAMTLLSLSVVSANDYTVSGTSFDDISSTTSSLNPNDSILLGNKTYISGSIKTINVNTNNVTIKGQSSSSKAVLNAQGSGSRVLIVRGDNVRLENLIFVNANTDSIGCVLYSSGANLTIFNCEFSNNRGFSGPILLENSSLNVVIQSCVFINNSASPNTNVTGAAGAIDSHSSNGKFINCIFKNNFASKGGGALYFIFGKNNTVINCNFINNSAILGGAIWLSTNGTALSIIRSNFTNNRATNNGGAIYSTNSFVISNSNFIGNSAKNGGAIYNNAPLTISSSIFKSNKASSNGGAIYANNNLNISGGSITSNTAGYGSGIYNIGILRISKVSFSSNVAKIYGIGLSAPSQILQGKMLTVNAFVTKGDNIVNSIFTKTNDVRINGKTVIISNKMPNKVITIINGNKKVNKKTGDNGIATYKIEAKKNKDKKNYNIKISSTFSQNNKKFTKSITVKAVTKLSKPTNKVSNVKSNVPLYKNDMDRVVKNSNYNITSIDSKHVSYWNKRLNKDTKLYPYIKYQYIVTINRTGKLSKNKVEVWEKASTDIYFIKNATLSKNFNKYLKDVKYVIAIPKTSLKNEKIKKAVINIFKDYNGELTSNTKAELIVKWMRTEVKYPNSIYWNTKKGVLKTLSSKLGNCVDQTHLAVALLRSVGIPAQYWNYGSVTLKSGFIGGHVFGLAYVNGMWLEFDPTSSSILQKKLGTVTSRVNGNKWINVNC